MGHHYFRSNSNVNETRKERFYKFLKEDKFTDVTLISEEGMEVKAHRMVLSSATAFFDNIFQKCNNKNTENPVIFLYGIKFAQLKSIIEFIYLGETTIEEKNLNTFLLISKLMKIEDMRKIEPVTSHSESVIKRNSEKTHCLKNKTKVQEYLNEELIKEANRKRLNHGGSNLSTKTTSYSSSKTTTTSSSYSSSRSGITSPSLSLSSNQSVGSQRESLEKLRESVDEYFEKKKNRSKIQTGNGKFNCCICEREDFASQKHLDFHSETFHNKHFE